MRRFLVEAQLPPALARWLRANGHDASHISDLGLQMASGIVVWNYALASSSAIVSKDEDFAPRKVLAEDGPIVVWIRLPNTRKRELLIWFEVVFPDILMALQRGDSLIEVT